jgi:hypothetical protein
MVIDTLLVLLFTWIWFAVIQKSEHAFGESIGYTIYITVLFGAYYYAYDMIWTSSHEHER